MKKLMLLAAMLAMVLAISVPAFAADNTGTQFAIGCIQEQNAVQEVTQYAIGGDADAETEDVDQDSTVVVDVDVQERGPGNVDFDDGLGVNATSAQYVVTVAEGGDATNVVTGPTQVAVCDSEIVQEQNVGDVNSWFKWWW